jgi:hypothetical protein
MNEAKSSENEDCVSVNPHENVRKYTGGDNAAYNDYRQAHTHYIIEIFSTERPFSF